MNKKSKNVIHVHKGGYKRYKKGPYKPKSPNQDTGGRGEGGINDPASFNYVNEVVETLPPVVTRVLDAEKSAASKKQKEADDNVGMALAKKLAHNEKKVRDKAMKILRNYMIRKQEITELDMLKIWKGIFYCKRVFCLNYTAH